MSLVCLRFSTAFALHLGGNSKLFILALALYHLLLSTSLSSSFSLTVSTFPHYALAPVENFGFTNMSTCFCIRVFP